MERVFPAKVCLGATVFLEHLTATGAHVLFAEPEVAELMHPEMRRFWLWHAAEELEHKAVAFDVFRAAGGGFALRVASAIAAVLFLAIPFIRITRRMARQDSREVTREMRRAMRDLNRKIGGTQLRMIGEYFLPGFHPWNNHDQKYLTEWYGTIASSASP